MLNICTLFFNYLNSNKIEYCHWKSNAHLDKALCGETDLDLLVAPSSRSSFQKAIDNFSIKKIISPPEKQFPGMEDYLGFDEETGTLIHLHVHYQLVLGEKYIKNHHLPLENIFFKNLIDSDSNVKIPCPEIELILLIIRAHMKVDFISIIKHFVKDFFGHFYTAFPADIEGELHELIDKSDVAQIKYFLNQFNLPLNNKIFIDFINNFSNSRLKFYHIIIRKIKIMKGLRSFRRKKSIFVYFTYVFHLLKNSSLFSNFFRSSKKKIGGAGAVISFVGADGSGKSTLVEEIGNWLSWKLTVVKVYHGIPKTYFVKSISNLTRVLRKFRIKPLASLLRTMMWIGIARNRYKQSFYSHKIANNGVVVITDRFPLQNFHSMPEPMDGPRLKGNSKWFSDLEYKYYKNIKYPDKVFVLQVDLDELRRRKTDLPLETHKIKAEAVNSITTFGPIELIKSNKKYSEVVLEIKRKIWELI